jgi:hypothetical protein
MARLSFISCSNALEATITSSYSLALLALALAMTLAVGPPSAVIPVPLAAPASLVVVSGSIFLDIFCLCVCVYVCMCVCVCECKATAGSKAANKFAKDPHEYLFWRTGSYTAFRYGAWKLQATWLPDRVWLTDLNNDEGEKHNLAQGLLWSDFKAILDVSPYHAVCVQMTTALAQATQNCTFRDNDAIIDRLCAVGRRLQAVASEQVDPLWPALTEVPISVDYARAGVRTWEEEYVYWAV